MHRIATTIALIASFSGNPAYAQWSTIRQDARALVQGENLLVLAGGLGLAKAMKGWDPHVNGSLDSNPVLETTDFTNLVNKTSFNIPIALLAYTVGRASGREGLRSLSSDVLRTLIAVQLIVGPIKHTVGRERPDGSNHLSFPSGHTANAFAMAEVFRGHYGWKAGVPMYALGGLTAIGRMEEDVHYLSDVVAGAAFGYVIGHAMNSGSNSRVKLLPYGAGLAMGIRF